MANEIQFGYTTGRTLTYGVYQPDGTVRTAAGTALAEVAGTGYYKATDASVVAGDYIIVIDSVLGTVGQGQYETATSSLATTAHLQDVEDKLDTVDTNVDTVSSLSSTSCK